MAIFKGWWLVKAAYRFLTKRPLTYQPLNPIPWCWDRVDGCTGRGRPTCNATECMYGVEPCTSCNGFRAVGLPCAFCSRTKTAKPQ